MDLFKVFTCLPHDSIIAKLHAYGVGYDSLRPCLSNRHQIVKLDSYFSSRLQTIIRVSQGSRFWPLLFHIFLNDSLFVKLRSVVCNFADANKPYCCQETTEDQ